MIRDPVGISVETVPFAENVASLISQPSIYWWVWDHGGSVASAVRKTSWTQQKKSNDTLGPTGTFVSIPHQPR